MSDQFWLTKAQLKRIEPFFPQTRGIPCVDDRRVVSGIVHVIRNGLRWRDAPAVYRPHKTLYNRFVRWSRMGIFDRIFANLAAESGPPDRVMIDSTHLKAHRTAASLVADRLEAVKWENWKVAFYDEERDWWTPPPNLASRRHST
jgi:transposase